MKELSQEMIDLMFEDEGKFYYLDWLNNFLTIKEFALHHGMHIEKAEEIIIQQHRKIARA